MVSRGLSAIIVDVPNVFYPTGTWFNRLFSNYNGFPSGLLWVAGFTVICMYIMYKNKIGRYILSIGSNEEATRLSGINTDRYKIIAYVITGLGAGIAAVFSHTGKVGKGIAAAVLVIVGGWLTMHPLWLTAWISRFLGMLIMVNSGMDLIYAWKQKRNVVFYAAATAIGAVLILLPMTASRLVFTLCGIAVLVIGAVMLLDRIRGRRWLKEGDDPNIIDAL